MARQLGLRVYKPDKAYQGYTLFAPLRGSDVYLIDMEGKIVHRWIMPYRVAEYGYLLDNGNLLCGGYTGRSPVTFGGRSGAVLEVDWDGNVLWRYEEDTLHHDFCRMENGDTMVLGWEAVPPEVARRVKGGVPDPEGKVVVWSDYFKEIAPNGAVAWEWHAYEHLDLETDVLCPLHQRDEWTHCNTCEVLADGNILTSFRVLNTVGIIDKVTGDFLWKWGKEELGHQHDPTLLENGNILIFDNGFHSLTSPLSGSRVIEVNPTTNQIEWQYATQPRWEFSSSFISGAQRLPNGDTLICEGMTGRLFEVTRDGEVVWEFVNPFFGHDEAMGHVNLVFRAYRYDPDFSGFMGKQLSPETYAWLNHVHGL